MQTIGFGGIAGSLLIVGEVESAWAAIAAIAAIEVMEVMAVGSALGAFVTGGFSVNHMDIAPPLCGDFDGDHEYRGDNPRHHRRVCQWTDPSSDGLLGAGLPGDRRGDLLRTGLLFDLRERPPNLRLSLLRPKS